MGEYRAKMGGLGGENGMIMGRKRGESRVKMCESGGEMCESGGEMCESGVKTG